MVSSVTPPSSVDLWISWRFKRYASLSPQARGRMERTAGSFQGRWATELLLAGDTIEEQGNKVLHIQGGGETDYKA